MILDKFLIFRQKTDAAAAVTRALPLGQNDLPLNPTTDGMGPYQNLYLVVQDSVAGTAGTVQLQHSDLEAGPFTTVASYTTPATYDAGDIIVKVPVPFKVKNWVRLQFSAASQSDAFLVYGVDKAVLVND